MMKVSIIVPVYNVENYLDICVQSIITQTHKDIEIILIDDGSTDCSSTICDRWGKKDGRIIVIHQHNAGLSEARNVGIKVASGEYVVFVDGDDYIEEDSIETMLRICEQERLEVLKARYIVHYTDGTTMISAYCDFKLNSPLNGVEYLVKAYRSSTYNAGVCVGMYNKDFIRENNLFFKKKIYHAGDGGECGRIGGCHGASGKPPQSAGPGGRLQ